ncbi:unnamed protein product, partial [Pleuronectes platessa]
FEDVRRQSSLRSFSFPPRCPSTPLIEPCSLEKRCSETAVPPLIFPVIDLSTHSRLAISPTALLSVWLPHVTPDRGQLRPSLARSDDVNERSRQKQRDTSEIAVTVTGKRVVKEVETQTEVKHLTGFHEGGRRQESEWLLGNLSATGLNGLFH